MSSDMSLSRTAGAVIVGLDGKIVVVSQHGDSWSLPKGHIEAGETEQETTKREVFEETGLKNIQFIQKLGEYNRKRIGKDGVGEDTIHTKHISIFLCKTDEKELAPQDPENPEARWVDIDEVAMLLTHEKDKQFFNKITPIVRDFLAN